MTNETERRLFEGMLRVKQYPADLRDPMPGVEMTDQEAVNGVLELRKCFRSGELKAPISDPEVKTTSAIGPDKRSK